MAPVDFSGKWKLEKVENLDDYMKKLSKYSLMFCGVIVINQHIILIPSIYGTNCSSIMNICVIIIKIDSV